MQIEILDVKVENKGKYNVANVSFKRDDGKVDGKNIMSFTYKEVFKTLSQAKLGDRFNVKAEKNDKGYWDWVEVEAAGKNTNPSSTESRTTVRSNFETPEERARRQVYIVRQSSLSAAIELAGLNKAKSPITEEDIIASARKLEAYVFDTGAVVEPAEVT